MMTANGVVALILSDNVLLTRGQALNAARETVSRLPDNLGEQLQDCNDESIEQAIAKLMCLGFI